MTPAADGPPPRPGRRLLVRALLAALVIALATAGASATAGLMTLEDYIAPAPGDAHPIHAFGLGDTKPGSQQTVLLMGSDSRE